MTRRIPLVVLFALALFSGCTPLGENIARRAPSGSAGDIARRTGPAGELRPAMVPLDAGTRQTLQEYGPAIKECAARYGFDWRLILAVIKQESRFEPEAESQKGASGLMQVMPVTQAEFRLALGHFAAGVTVVVGEANLTAPDRVAVFEELREIAAPASQAVGVFVQGLQQLEDLLARLAVEVAGRLVGQQQRGMGHERAGERHPLLLAARQRPGPMRDARQQSHAREQFLGARMAFRRRPPGDTQRHLDVFERGELRQQVMELVDEAEVHVPPAALLGRAHLREVAAFQRDAPGGGPVEPAQQVQQRALARARGADDRDEFALSDFKIDAPKHV